MGTKMIRVPFEVELAKKITEKSVDGRIVTRDGRSARVICWDFSNIQNIVSAISQEDGVENVSYNFHDGTCCLSSKCDEDLFIEIPEYMTFKDGDIIAFGYNEDSIAIGIFNRQTSEKSHECYVMKAVCGALVFDAKPLTYKKARFATESEKQKLIDALKSSKEPKSKEYLKRFFGIEEKGEYEFKPFDKVLVRDGNDGCWHADIFSHKNKDRGRYYCTGYEWRQCIPYNEQTAHLLGTTENYE